MKSVAWSGDPAGEVEGLVVRLAALDGDAYRERPLDRVRVVVGSDMPDAERRFQALVGRIPVRADVVITACPLAQTVPDADLVVLMTNANGPLKDDEVQFLQRAAVMLSEPPFVVLSPVGSAAADGVAQVSTVVRRQVTTLDGPGAASWVFPVAAAEPGRPGFRTFERAMTVALRRRRLAALVRAMSSMTSTIVMLHESASRRLAAGITGRSDVDRLRRSTADDFDTAQTRLLALVDRRFDEAWRAFQREHLAGPRLLFHTGAAEAAFVGAFRSALDDVASAADTASIKLWTRLRTRAPVDVSERMLVSAPVVRPPLASFGSGTLTGFVVGALFRRAAIKEELSRSWEHQVARLRDVLSKAFDRFRDDADALFDQLTVDVERHAELTDIRERLGHLAAEINDRSADLRWSSRSGEVVASPAGRLLRYEVRDDVVLYDASPDGNVVSWTSRVDVTAFLDLCRSLADSESDAHATITVDGHRYTGPARETVAYVTRFDLTACDFARVDLQLVDLAYHRMPDEPNAIVSVVSAGPFGPELADVAARTASPDVATAVLDVSPLHGFYDRESDEDG
ncbi:hypothetical protein Vse01_54160 [Micromonospora sediminimaris]|uniref:Uncharacterized protein n=1 Tax=Micromonospora sediminimaris TaxID=547162 RepID=A0A9W5UXJ5_9ACTN|nr:hypothetical protein Vse01_54160 [Micromonospora sediminimaris]